MVEDFIGRENYIFDILHIFLKNKLDFVLIGGYAVSAFKHRFSIDADLVVKEEDLIKFEGILLKQGFKKSITKELKNVYASRFLRFEKKDRLPVYIDLMVNGVSVRQTNASFGFEKLFRNSTKIKVIGVEKEIIAKVPQKELLIALKLHSGRLTDFRDIVALTKDIKVKKIKEFLLVGDLDKVKKHLNELISLLDKKDFIDSFKGVFIEKKFDIDLEQIKKLKKLL